MAQVAGALSIASAAASVAQGVNAKRVADAAAKRQNEQGKRAALAAREEAKRLVAAQRVALSASGRRIEGGTVGALLSDTMAQAQERERDILEASGAQAATLKNQGLSSMLSGVGTGLSGLASWSEGRYQANARKGG